MLRSLLSGALRSGTRGRRSSTGTGGLAGGSGLGTPRRSGGGDIGSAVGGQVGRSLLSGLLRRR